MKKMRYATVCSGVEAPSVAWHHLGWQPVFFSEIDSACNKLLSAYYPNVPNLGDMKNINGEKYNGAIDIICGGTPCQSFSVAGLRKGFSDPRGNLALIFLRLVDQIRPRWVLWENVPGVLSSNKGRDFGSFLGALVELGYGFAYRVLDAQYFGVPQTRSRVFVLGHSGGDWKRPAEVLFEPKGLFGHPEAGRKKGKTTAALTATGVGVSGADDNSANAGYLMPDYPLIMAHGQSNAELCINKCPNLTCNHEAPILFVQNQRDEVRIVNIPGAIQAQPGMKQQTYLAFNMRGREHGNIPEINTHGKVSIRASSGGSTNTQIVFNAYASASQSMNPGDKMPALDVAKKGGTAMSDGIHVRRLTPLECERAQGFPDNYTKITDKTCDAPRYKQMGNSMAVPVIKWLGERIQMVEDANLK